MKNLYVLLVGIDKYSPPNAVLKGCVKDINQIENFLNEYYAKEFDLKVKRLENENATYDNIKKGFREHLGQAGPSDIVWFHFSGHGSEEKTAKEFLTIEPTGKDQTLICSDSGVGKSPNLADKELAVLLNEVATKNKPQPPHIMVSLDCCHSGSGTRSVGQDLSWTSRSAPSSGAERTLASYADGYYSNLQSLEVPSSKHVVLSACKSVQTAGDMPEGGAFTTGLVKALRAAKGNVSYNDLFLRARSAVRNVRDNQTPQFDTVQNFDPYVRFLEGTPTGDKDLYEVECNEGKWAVKCGAIHGLPTDPAKPIEFDVYTLPPEKKKVGLATIKSVGAQLSPIDMDIENEGGVVNFFKNLIDHDDDKPKQYLAALKHLPNPPHIAKLTGDAQLVSSFQNNKDLKPKHVAWAEPDDKPSLDVKIESSGITIMDLDRGQKAFNTNGTSTDDMKTVRDALDKIVVWRRFIELANKSRSQQVRGMVRYELEEYDRQGDLKKTHTEEDIRIYASSKDLEDAVISFIPVLNVQNVKQNLYIYSFFVGYDYSIECPEGENVYRDYEHTDLSNVRINLWKSKLGWGPAPGNSEDTCHFKLLVTTEALDFQQFLQSGLEQTRTILKTPKPDKVFGDWADFNFAVTLVRQDSEISAGGELSLADGNLKIKAHPSMRGSVSIGHAETNARSAGPINAFARLQQGEHISIMDFSPSRGSQTQNIIEINDIHLDSEDALEKQPLEITLKQKTDEGELLLPIAFDGVHYHVIGDATSDDNGTHVTINEIPDMVQTDPNAVGERGIFKSLKMTFFKVALAKPVNELRWVDTKPDGTLELQKENLGLKIGKAKKTLLVLHGLAGDGLNMYKSIRDNIPAKNIEGYDLILVYDYESLNTPLDETATTLATTLADYGFGSDDKKVTVIGYSVGGLIARWMIEKCGGKSFIDHCILVGTPNNGSMFGRADSYLKWAKTVLDMSVNFIPSIVPFSGILVKFFKTASDLGGSIAQIDPNSDFINKLNSGCDAAVRYTVISGDAEGVDYEGSGYDGFIDKAKKQLAKYMNEDEPNDLFAPVKSLQCKILWEDGHKDNKVLDPLSVHHFGYFAEQGGTRNSNTIWKVLAEEV